MSLKEDQMWWLPKISHCPPEISTVPDARTHIRLGLVGGEGHQFQLCSVKGGENEVIGAKSW